MSGATVPRNVLVHLAGGIGDIVLATPLLAALVELGCRVELLLDADYPGAGGLFADWAAVAEVHEGGARPLSLRPFDLVIPAAPPYYATRFQARFLGAAAVAPRPPAALFSRDVQGWYLAFARALGYPAERRPAPRLPIPPAESGSATLVIAPGCKTGIMATKRWPHFAELAERFEDVLLVGTPDDLGVGSPPRAFPAHVRSALGRLSLRETAEVMAAAGAVLANDSGLGHVAAATGVPTLLLFGPTPHQCLEPFPANVVVLRTGLPCEPCWHGRRFGHCRRAIDCLRTLAVDRVAAELRRLLGDVAPQAAGPGMKPPAHAGIVGGDVAASANGAAAAPAASAGTVRIDVARPSPRLRASPDEPPLVSCLMPTADRRDRLPQAICCFLRQDYPRRELIVLDDGAQPVEDLMPADPRVRYVRLDRRLVIGAKRNRACELAAGEIIAHWDDDDWSADWRLSYQVAALRAAPAAGVCGLARLLFFDQANDRGWLYEYAGARRWVAGGTFCYRKALWQRAPFPDVREGEDTRFVWRLKPTEVLVLPDFRFYVAAVHSRNTSRKRTSDPRWSAFPTDRIQALIRHGGRPAEAVS